jgi:chemotaxis protein MotB
MIPTIRRRKLSPETEDRHRDRWLLSYADLVTLLLALFIVLYAASDKERARAIAATFSTQNAGGQTGGSGILPGNREPGKDEQIEKDLRANDAVAQHANIQQTSRGLIVSISEAGFFQAGDATVGADANNVIKELAETLKENGMPVRVEGHTDSTPISNPRFSSNWELSTARAANVLQKLVEYGFPPERLSAAGYGGFQPVADNTTPEGRAQNRRVDIVILNR